MAFINTIFTGNLILSFHFDDGRYYTLSQYEQENELTNISLLRNYRLVYFNMYFTIVLMPAIALLNIVGSFVSIPWINDSGNLL